MKIYITVIVLMLALVLTGCSRTHTANDDKDKKEPIVAKVGDSKIIADDFKDYLSQRPLSSKKHASKESLDKRLDEMVIEEVLVQEALRLKIDQDPGVKKRIRQILTQALMENQINKKVWERQITDSEFKEYYDSQGHKYNRPAQVRLADIFIAVAQDAPLEMKAELKNKADMILSEAIEARNKRSGFAALVRKYSDTPDNYKKGDTGFFDVEGKPFGIDKGLAAAAFNLERNGSICEQVIKSRAGFHVVMRIGKKAAFHKPLKSVKDHIAQEIKREEIKSARKELIDRLKGDAGIKIDASVMAMIEKEIPVPERKMPFKAE